MENAVKLDIPLEVEVSEADNWYDVKQDCWGQTSLVLKYANEKYSMHFI